MKILNIKLSTRMSDVIGYTAEGPNVNFLFIDEVYVFRLLKILVLQSSEYYLLNFM